jgi:hypothetical protein
MRPSEDGRIEAESSSSKPENQQPKTCHESRPRTERAALQRAQFAHVDVRLSIIRPLSGDTWGKSSTAGEQAPL